jgi:hypothetical protein
VPAGGSRRGRRDNGLIAAEYAAVGDVDPRVGEHLLDVFAGEGIAAYLLPATDLHPVTRTTTLPARPTDRLFADRDHLGTAKEYLARLRADEAGDEPMGGPGAAGAPAGVPSGRESDNVDVDAAWARIVAGYDAEIDSTAAPWPASENVPERGHDDTDPDLGRKLGLDEDTREHRAPDPPATQRPADEPTLLDALDTVGADLPDDDEGYTPPPPPPVPRPPAPVVVALLAIAGGLVLFFQPGILLMSAQTGLLVGFLLLLAGVVTLIWRLRPGDDEDEPGAGDDGAVV